MGPDREVALDLTALRASASYSLVIERKLVLAFINVAERCIPRIAGLVVGGGHQEWRSVVQELEDVSVQIHARELAAICKRALDGSDTHVSRLGAYLEIKEAYDEFLICEVDPIV